jgi:hypothetical protein
VPGHFHSPSAFVAASTLASISLIALRRGSPVSGAMRSSASIIILGVSNFPTRCLNVAIEHAPCVSLSALWLSASHDNAFTRTNYNPRILSPSVTSLRNMLESCDNR